MSHVSEDSGVQNRRVAGLHRWVWDGDMKVPDEEQPDRARKLENIVDRLDEKVADERESQDVPGKPSDREQTATRGSEDEPPD